MVQAKKSQFEELQDRWIAHQEGFKKSLLTQHGEAISWILNNSRQLAAGALGGLFLLTSPSQKLLSGPHSLTVQAQEFEPSKSTFLISDLDHALPEEIRELSSQEEQTIAEILTRTFGFTVTPTLEGKKLNRSYGYIGAEQHLARYPGDTMATHFDSEEDSRKYYSSGMAPGLGAWGYFAQSQGALTEKDTLREKYYIAVQTFLSDGFNERVREYSEFYKHRKMLVVNSHNGRAVVVVIGDAGPAAWTGKHLGGSPEVMKYLERVDGRARGPVLYYFIDDSEDQIPLGPIAI